MKFYQWFEHRFESKVISIVLCILTLLSGMPMSLYASPTVDVINKDSVADFNAFIENCSLEERIQMMQSLRGLDDDLKDEWFGKLDGLATISHFTTDKNKASATLPMKPENFNQVLPETVIDAIQKGYLKRDCVSRENICREIVWRRYNKCNYYLHSHNNINYHEDIVQWVAKKNGIDDNQIKGLPTYALERKISESYFANYFAKMWDQLTVEEREVLLSKIEEQSNCTIPNKFEILCLGGSAVIVLISTTVAFAGFAFYTTMSTVICTVAGLLGCTLPFVVYTTASTAVAILAGPLGWIIAAGALSVSLGWSESDTMTNFIMVVNAIKAKHLQLKWGL